MIFDNLNDPFVEDAALEWFGKLGYSVGREPHPPPGGLAAEPDNSISLPHQRAWALPKLLGGELNENETTA